MSRNNKDCPLCHGRGYNHKGYTCGWVERNRPLGKGAKTTKAKKAKKINVIKKNPPPLEEEI